MVKQKLVCLIGASFDTGNLGVSALAWSSIKLIKSKWPHARIIIIGGSRVPAQYTFSSEGCTATITISPVRYAPNILIKNHVFWLWLAVGFVRLFPFMKRNVGQGETTLAVLLRADIFCDITGGDSFSDIYGIGRYLKDYVLKRICQMTGKPFILLPQTYGPFKSQVAKFMARSILKRASAVYSRDREGLEQIRQLMVSRKMTAQPKLCPDVAFVLDPREPASSRDAELKSRISELKTQNSELIGLNISGLLYNGGYTRDNMFELKCDYRQLVQNVIEDFVSTHKCSVLLVPHVIPDNMPVENDLDACRAVWSELPKEIQEKVLILDGKYDQNEVKYWIGQCDFFLGARMHSTIAALSQCIPAVGMAYSKKFVGLFDTVGVEDCVIDMRHSDEQQVLSRIQEAYANRREIRKRLIKAIPQTQSQILFLFK